VRTEERLKKLERELTDLKAELAKCVRTGAVELKDKNGKPRAVLALEHDVPGLRLLDEIGNVRAELTVSGDGPALWLCGENGRVRAALALKDDVPGLGLYNTIGKSIWQAPPGRAGRPW